MSQLKQLFVKICGITRPQDAELAVSLGANALGFVFWPHSPRCVNVEAARAMAENMPVNVLKVGVFVDQPADDVMRIMDDVGLDVAQLHGHESPDIAGLSPAEAGHYRNRKPGSGSVRLQADHLQGRRHGRQRIGEHRGL